MQNSKSVIETALPWTAGAGFATGHMLLTTQCTLAAVGICSGCAGCAIALVSLVGWGACKDRLPQGSDTKDR
jgi:hypothetical protein